MSAKSLFAACVPEMRSLIAHMTPVLHRRLASPPLPVQHACRDSAPVSVRALQQRRNSSAASPELEKPLKASIGVIGAGQMGEALIRGFLKSGVSSAERICASVATLERGELLSSLGIGNVFDDVIHGGAQDVASFSDIIIVGVKPQTMSPVLQALSPVIEPRHLIISIAAGIQIETIENDLGAGARVIRVMPNTPCLVQAGASAYSLGTNASMHDADLAHALFYSVGLAIEVEEKMMNAVTGLSGSGPAYVFMMIEALADGGVAAGLPRDTALALAAQTVAGAAQMVLQEGETSTPGIIHPAILKDKVASPAGTTITGLCELENSGIRGAFIRAVKAAAGRSQELG